jgi:tRNA pseudouridine38-40 synthase
VTRWRIVLEYDGAPFAGWQLQEGAPTVQGAVEDALVPLLGHHARVHGAGRTDAGVHAAMQVAVFNTSTDRTARAIRDGLNAHLPAGIACVEAEVVDAAFDPRRARHTKTYRYTWLVRPAPSPLRRGRVWHVRGALDPEPMHAAVQAIVGTHDLSSFRATGDGADSPIRSIESASVTAQSDEVHLRITGVGFLRHTIRIVAGTLYEIGTGARPIRWFADVLAARDRFSAGRTAPPEGLLLEAIDYTEDRGPRTEDR